MNQVIIIIELYFICVSTCLHYSVLFGLGLPMESEVSVILGYVLKCNYNLPYNSSSFTSPTYRNRHQRDMYNNNNDNDNSGKIKRERNKNNVKSFRIKSQQSLSRWDLYRILESALGSFGSPGKVCLLRAVCEAAELPFDRSHGLLGELLHTFLSPSSTSEYPDVYEDRQYLAAENIGKNSLNKLSKGQCKSFFPECIYSPLDYFTL
ncbi:uncharacterized protein LOC141534881 isoform X2 [Cotesia typhae]|uniref:uncharacterized protein LOC141534881 isoform X2 n=1 Tax=Cotesia typhae TaxID=2053667 RepID=UPI003D68913C